MEVYLYGYLFTVGNVDARYKRETALIPRYIILSKPQKTKGLIRYEDVKCDAVTNI
jgi:hypothetical protein